jgi:hypothetical protein
MWIQGLGPPNLEARPCVRPRRGPSAWRVSCECITKGRKYRRPSAGQRRHVHPPLARQRPEACPFDVVGLEQGAIVIGEAGQVGCQVWQRFGDILGRADRWRATGKVDSVETGPPRLSSAHIAQRPTRTHGDEASNRPPTIEAGGVDLEQPTQRLLCRVVEVMRDAPTGPPDHALHHGHKLARRQAEGFSDRVAWAGRWVRRWAAIRGRVFHGPAVTNDMSTIVVVTKAMPAPGVEPGLPVRGEGF